MVTGLLGPRAPRELGYKFAKDESPIIAPGKSRGRRGGRHGAVTVRERRPPSEMCPELCLLRESSRGLTPVAFRPRLPSR